MSRIADEWSPGDVIAGAASFTTCHPCHGYPQKVIGDQPGAWVANMRTHWGDACVPLVINGCCGNIHHTDHTSPNPMHDHRKMADMLTETTHRILGAMEPITVDKIAVDTVTLPLPVRTPDADAIAAAARLLDAHPEPIWLDEAKTRVDWDWVYAVNVLDLADAALETLYLVHEIQSFSLGTSGRWVSWGNHFVEAQLEIKQASPSPHTFVAYFCTICQLICPPRRPSQAVATKRVPDVGRSSCRMRWRRSRKLPSACLRAAANRGGLLVFADYELHLRSETSSEGT